LELRNAAILICVRRRDFRQAVVLAEQTCAAGIADACSFGLLGHALSSMGRHSEAVNAYSEAFKLGPHDPYVRHLVAAGGIVPSGDRAPTEYVRAVFDGCAEQFESHILGLGYRIPGLIRAVLATHPLIARGEPVGPVLDLGCGTGLLGVALSDLPLHSLVGVDLSPGMLAVARQKCLYAALHQSELLKFLTAPAPSAAQYALMLGADVFCYFGALEELFAAAHGRLLPGGWLVCSFEELLPDAEGGVTGDNGGLWALHRQGRYAHGLGYLLQAAAEAGFKVNSWRREALRFEAGEPVAGIILVLERIRHDA
jgi:predicted TPR repeat methyltransferase